MKKISLILLAALSLTACKRDSSVVYLNGDDDDIIIRVDDGMKVNLTVNWSDLASAPDGMTVYLYPTGNDTVDSTVRSWHFDNVQSASVTVPEQDYSVICFNQSENELAGYVFDFRDYATATVTAKDLSNLAPLAIASMSSLQSTRALNLMGVLKPVNVVKTMSLKIHVAGVNERVEVKGTLSNMPAGVTMCDRKPLPKPVDLTLPTKDWTVKATSDDEIDLDITFNSFGIFLDDETRAAGNGDDDYVAETRVALDDSDLRNILHLEITAEDGTVTKLDYDVTQELIRQYRIAIESEATSSNSTPQFDNQFFFSYHAADTTATLVSGVGMGKVEIPEYVQHDGLSYKVTEIGAQAFRGCTYMTSVSIPESVTRIRSYAFAECAGLSSLSLPQSLKLIGVRAFEQCRTLTEVTIPEQVDSLGGYAFYYCQMLTKVNYNARHCICYGGDYGSVFTHSSEGDTGLGVTTLNIGNQVEHIPASVFSGLSNLKTVTIPNSVTSIGNNAFYECTGLTSIVIPSSVTSIGNNAFRYCSGLTSITIPSSVTSIGSRAFSGCTGLTSVTIPSSVTSIGDDAFYDVANVVYNGSAEGAPWGASFINGIVEDDFILADEEKTKLTKYIGKGGDVTIPATVTSIGESAFYMCSGLTSVTIPDGVTSIGNGAFQYCYGLTSVTIPSSVTSISSSAFEYCSGLTSVTIPSSVTSIGKYAFGQCTGLTSVTIPSSVTSIGEGAFYGCTGLTSVTIPSSVTSIGYFAFNDVANVVYNGSAEGAPWGASFINGIVEDGIVFDAEKTQLIKYCGNGGDVTIPATVTSIGEKAFNNCTGLTSVTIPDGVTSIGDYAFRGCSGLTSITIPSSVTSIGSSAFQGCSGLTSVTIPSSVISIDYRAFYGCTGLTSVTIPSSVKYIGDDAFYGIDIIYYNGSASSGEPWGANKIVRQ
ncbi:MAG: leucine-rich repeat protein [Bacteroidales bacterium]|nr:leucine-rich repeat protein [Bacteroidales bacterium]